MSAGQGVKVEPKAGSTSQTSSYLKLTSQAVETWGLEAMKGAVQSEVVVGIT